MKSAKAKPIPEFFVDDAIERETFYEENLMAGRLRVAALIGGYTVFGWGVNALVMWLFFRHA